MDINKVIDGIVFSPAEKAVVNEQLQSMDVLMTGLRHRLLSESPACQWIKLWVALDKHREYVGALIAAKVGISGAKVALEEDS